MGWRELFPHRLQHRREALGLTKTALGHAAGVTKVAIREFEIGRKVPTVDTLVALADALECSVDWLLGRSTHCDSPPKGGDTP